MRVEQANGQPEAVAGSGLNRLRILALVALVLGSLLAGCMAAQAANKVSFQIIVIGHPLQLKTSEGLQTLRGNLHDLPRSATLVLKEGTKVIIAPYGSGKPTVLEGPLEKFALARLPGSPPRERRKGQEQRGLFDKRSDTSSLGGSRGSRHQGEHVRLLRPVPGPVLKLEGQGVRWDCAACGPLKVKVYEYDDEVLWSAEAERTVRYGGPDLPPSTVVWLSLEGLREPIPLEVLRPEAASRVSKALSFCSQREAQLREAGIVQPAALEACAIEAYRAAGLHSDALATVDRLLNQEPDHPRLLELLEDIERDAGLRE